MNAPFDKGFRLEELATMAMFALLDVLIVVFSSPMKVPGIFTLNLFCISLIVFIRVIHQYMERNGFAIFRDWLVVLVLIVMYMEHTTLIPLINPHDVDDLLIQMDRFLFGGHDPTVLLERFASSVLTEIFQIVYASFYFLPIAFCFLLYRKEDKAAFHLAASTILIGFYVSYIGYYLSPAVGPRFTLEHLHRMPLEGLFAFHFLRDTLDTLEGFTRDCCPSGHTLVSVLTVMLAGRYCRPFVKTALVWTVLLLISTVYLRYHYVVDIIAGFVLAVAVYGLVFLIRQYTETAGNGNMAAVVEESGRQRNHG